MHGRPVLEIRGSLEPGLKETADLSTRFGLTGRPDRRFRLPALACSGQSQSGALKTICCSCRHQRLFSIKWATASTSNCLTRTVATVVNCIYGLRASGVSSLKTTWRRRSLVDSWVAGTSKYFVSTNIGRGLEVQIS